jgi:hypothetical protein
VVQGIEARRVWQVVPTIKDISRDAVQGRAIVIPVGELEKGGAAYLAELMLPTRPAGAVRIAQTDVTFNVPSLGAQRQAMDLVIQYSSDPAVYTPLNGHVMNIVERVALSCKLRRSMRPKVAIFVRKDCAMVSILLSKVRSELAGTDAAGSGSPGTVGRIPGGQENDC